MNILDYLGHHWVPGQFDCWSLVRLIYKNELDIHLPIIPVNAGNFIAVRKAFKHRKEIDLFKLTETPLHLCVVGMGFDKKMSHCGVYLSTNDGPRILHNHANTGVICQSINDLTQSQLEIIGYYQYVG